MHTSLINKVKLTLHQDEDMMMTGQHHRLHGKCEVVAIRDIIPPPLREVFNDVYIAYELMDTPSDNPFNQRLLEEHCQVLITLELANNRCSFGQIMSWMGKISRKGTNRAEVLLMCFTNMVYAVWIQRNNSVWETVQAY